MRIKEVGKMLVLYRYGGYVAETKKQLEDKIGSLAATTSPMPVGQNGKNTDGIPVEIWENLTGVEQKELVAFLTRKNIQIVQDELKASAANLALFADSISPLTVDAGIAQLLWHSLDVTGKALKAAGFPKPGKVVAKPAPIPG